MKPKKVGAMKKEKLMISGGKERRSKRHNRRTRGRRRQRRKARTGTAKSVGMRTMDTENAAEYALNRRTKRLDKQTSIGKSRKSKRRPPQQRR